MERHLELTAEGMHKSVLTQSYGKQAYGLLSYTVTGDNHSQNTDDDAKHQ